VGIGQALRGAKDTFGEYLNQLHLLRAPVRRYSRRRGRPSTLGSMFSQSWFWPSARFAKGKKATARLTLSERARAAIRRALRTGARIVVKLRVIVADGAGNRRTLTRQIRLRR
jgi:hypothetical protein